MGRVHYLALNHLTGLGPKTLRRLIERFGGAAEVLAAAPEVLVETPRVTPALAEAIKQAAADLTPFEELLLTLEEGGVWLLCWEDENYPVPLRSLPDAPLLLYGRGQLSEGDTDAVAIVGSRAASEAGGRWARRAAVELASRGLTVVSGFARGVDTAAHWGALEGGGRTLAVLGTGIDRLHPLENGELAERVAAQGALLTEFPPGTPPTVGTLMARDRIVSGLSRAVLVVEAGLSSGSLDTARRAREQGRGLYAVDWQGTRVDSPGTAQLLSAGACSLPADLEAVDFDALAEEIVASRPEDAAQLSLF